MVRVKASVVAGGDECEDDNGDGLLPKWKPGGTAMSGPALEMALRSNPTRWMHLVQYS